ncbi:hypothetical protein ASD21_00440 [Caulobacter sp. Root1455]|uniref:hypothetical protein n=1 Tax=Caulobacter sp. Root1455 TaxID=1736465 RepID=UPI0006F1E35A|nr:hypothetical protein [Caulobacter sp. Root1455]KQZ06146.1 hypothetical protein ASD21_00440 [Caulobacter sp. Root1455]
MKSIILPLLAAVLLAEAGAARAQTQAPAPAPASDEIPEESIVAEPVPPLSKAVPNSGPTSRGTALGGGAELQAGSDDSSVSAWLSWVDSALDANKGEASYRVRTLTLSSPLSEDASPAMAASLDTLAKAVSLEFKFSNVQAYGVRSPMAAELKALCKEARTRYTDKHGKGSDKGVRCAAVAADDPAMNTAWEDLFWDPKAKAVILGAAAKVGHQSFDYLETTTLASRSEDKAVWSVSGFATYFPRKARFLLSAGFEHQDAYEAADEATVCPAGPAPVTCAAGAYGEPVHKRSDVVSLEARKIFSRGLGVTAKVNHDFSDDVWGVEVPVYFVRNPSGEALTGGVKFGWRSDKHDLLVSLFFGKAFSLLNF